MRIRLRIDEQGKATVEHPETGESIKHVKRIDIVVTPVSKVSATLHIDLFEMDVVCDAKVVNTKPLYYDPDDIDSIDKAITLLHARRDRLAHS